MVHNTQNYWFLRLCLSSGILETKKQTFRKLDLFPSSGGGKTTTQMGPLETANINHWYSDLFCYGLINEALSSSG
jgi:hypothetical protein